VCFAGLGSGEVSAGGRKVVGLSQRRSRAGSLFLCAALLRWDPARLLDVLALSDDDRARATEELSPVAAGLDVDEEAVTNALLAQLQAR
jgi:lipoate-protein ligase A